VTAAGGIFLARPPEAADGIPLAVKDLLDTAGLTTTYGSAVFADHVPAETATAVARLEAAGYANVGKTNLHEFAYGITSENEHFGTVPNPIAPGRIAGGSSGGSAAALAAGLADAALGTDSGGSIRIPAACCGVVGFKPTFDLVPTDGCFPLAASFDHVGPMGRSVEACEQMLGALVPEFTPAAPHALDGLRIGVAWTEDADPLVRARVESAAATLGAQPVELARPPDGPGGSISDLFMHEVANVHRELYEEHGDLYGAEVAAKIERCLTVTGAAAARAAELREAYRRDALESMAGIDLMATPTIPCVAPAVGIGDAELRPRLLRFTFPINALGWPALALPCGPAEDGLPASIQLVGRPGADALVLAAGRLLEASLV
jgi:Asp-tRNA(Asn)/Glu-tRNA(Gln) amidotransferase A subunit family amidase